MSNLYKTIENLCLSKKVTITEMCKNSGASRASITDLKMGRKQNLSTVTLSKIANYFDVSVDYLLGKENTKKAPSNEDADILDGIDVGFLGDYKELTEENKAVLRDMVRLMRERQGGKE